MTTLLNDAVVDITLRNGVMGWSMGWDGRASLNSNYDTRVFMLCYYRRIEGMASRAAGQVRDCYGARGYGLPLYINDFDHSVSAVRVLDERLN